MEAPDEIEPRVDPPFVLDLQSFPLELHRNDSYPGVPIHQEDPNAEKGLSVGLDLLDIRVVFRAACVLHALHLEGLFREDVEVPGTVRDKNEARVRVYGDGLEAGEVRSRKLWLAEMAVAL